MFNTLKAMIGAQKVTKFIAEISADVVKRNPISENSSPEEANAALMEFIIAVMKAIQIHIGQHDEDFADRYAQSFLRSFGKTLYKKSGVSGFEMKEKLGMSQELYNVMMTDGTAVSFAVHNMWRNA